MPVEYTVRGKGGRYKLLGIAKGAGTSKNRLPIVVYECLDTGALWFREQGDFTERLEHLQSIAPPEPPI